MGFAQRWFLISLLFAGWFPACGKSEPSEKPSYSVERTSYSAIYLVDGNNGVLSQEDLQDHPEVVVVHSFWQLEKNAFGLVAIWIDKNAVSLVDSSWLVQEPQKYYPLVLVGYNSAQYSFDEKLNVFLDPAPFTDWSKLTLEPGFSVWMLTEDTSMKRSAFMRGYPETPSVQGILNVSDELLKQSKARQP